MIFFAALMMWAFSYTDYRRPAGEPATMLWRPLWDSINYYDFAREIYGFGLYFLSREKDNSEQEKQKEGRLSSDGDTSLKKTGEPQSSEGAVARGGPSGVVSKDDPLDTWTRWQAKEVRDGVRQEARQGRYV